MKDLLFKIGILAFLFTLNSNGQEQQELQRRWWEAQFPGREKQDKNLNSLPLIKVNGNRFVTEKGDSILFRGLAIADPDKIEYEGHWSKDILQKVKDLGATIVRIPVHPVAWRLRTPEKYLALLDQAVDWSTELKMYVIIDWHSIGNLKAGLFQDPMYITSLAETNNFWRTISNHFSGNNTVAFYELFNEPTTFRGQLGSISWSDWKKINEDLIKIIRAFDGETIPLVAGFDWAYDLTPLNLEPLDAQNIGYVTHPYPHKRTPPYEPKWEEDFGFAQNEYPVFATEFAFTLNHSSMAANNEYGNAIIKYLEGKGISWCWWVYDPEWHPTMFKSWDDYTLTDNGKFFELAAKGMIQK
jgi:aryl-phospho-beta-D-glucosidase BglC (GH1 family)